MNSQTIISKSLGINKIAVTNTLAIFSTMQQHGEILIKTTLEESPWLPGSSKDVCLYWTDFYSKYLNNLKFMADQGFAEIERISSPLLKPAENASPEKIATEIIPNPLQAKKSSDDRVNEVSAKEPSVDKMLPEKKPVTQNANIEQPVNQDKPDVKMSK